MNYKWDKILAPEETLQKEFSISPRYRIAVVSLLIVVGIIVCFQAWYIGIVIILLGVLYWFYLKHAKQYGFTEKRIILIDSFIGTSIVSIDYSQITDIEIEQSALDQFGGWGTIIINTAGTHVPEVHISFIDDPLSIKQELDHIRDAHPENKIQMAV